MVDVLKNKDVWQCSTNPFNNLPIVANNTAFVFTKNFTLLAINTSNGDIYWNTQLPSCHLPHLQWFGPILVNDQLYLYNALGDIFIVDPNTGTVVNYYRIDLHFLDKLSGPFAVVNGNMWFMGLSYLYRVK